MYSPKLRPELIGRLHAVCQELGIPMTRFVNVAVFQALVRAERRLAELGQGSASRSIGQEGPEESAREKGEHRPASEELRVEHPRLSCRAIVLPGVSGRRAPG